MSTPSNTTGRGWRSLFAGAAKIAAIGLVTTLFVCFAGVAVFWDADNFDARLRLERIRYAWFGDWLTPEDLAREVATDADLITALNKVEGLSLFLQSTIEPSGHVVTTGASFASSQDVIAGTTEKQWCYLTIGSGQVSKRLTLGKQDGNTAPAFESLDGLSPNDLSQIGLDAYTLELAARAHCRFDGFSAPSNPRED